MRRSALMSFFSLAVLASSVHATDKCFWRADETALSNPLLFLERDESLIHLSKQGVRVVSTWSCQDWEGAEACKKAGLSPEIRRFDKSGRLVERIEQPSYGTTSTRYEYDGLSPYPKLSVTEPSSGRRRVDARELVDDMGIPTQSQEWKRNADRSVDYVRNDRMVMSHFVNGRFESGVGYVLSLNGLDGIVLGGPKPSVLKDHYKIACKVVHKNDGSTLVDAKYTATLDGSVRTQAWRLDSHGNLTWTRDGLGNEIRYVTVSSDRKGNWLERKLLRDNGSYLHEFRAIDYYDSVSKD